MRKLTGVSLPAARPGDIVRKALTRSSPAQPTKEQEGGSEWPEGMQSHWEWGP